MRILFNNWRNLDHPLAGGAEIVLDQLAVALQARGHEVLVRSGGPGEERTYPTMRGGGDLSQYVLTPLHHHRVGRHHDVVVDVSNGMSFFTPLVDRNVPTVSFVHHVHTPQWAMYFPRPVAMVGRSLERDVMPRAYRNSLCVTVSPSSRDDLVDIGFRSDRIRILPPAAELDTARDPKADEPTFVALGRLTTHKRLDLLMKIWADVRPRLGGGELVIVGDGPERSRLEKLAPAGTRFVGWASDAEKARLLSSAWGLVHAAAHEGWGLVITEAGLAETPALAFDVAGVRDAVIPGETGLLVDTVEAFESEWLRFATDPALRSRLGAAARERSADAQLDRRVDVFENTLTEAVDLHHQVAPLGSLLSMPVTPTPAGQQTLGHVGIELSIVVPAFNEAERLPVLLRALVAARASSTTEIIVVDDGSADQTAEVARAELSGFAHGHVLSQTLNQGKGAALRRGVGTARGEFVMFMDADMATDLRDIDPMLDALRNAHVAIGSRTAHGAQVHETHFHRQLMGAAFNRLVRTLTSVDVRDSQCGFKAFRGSTARLLFHLSSQDGFGQDVELLELAGRLGLTIAEVPVRWQAMDGSKVRVIRDSLSMAASVCRLSIGPMSRAVIPTLSVSSHSVDPQVLAKELASLVRATDAVFHDNTHAHVLLPGVGDDCIDLVQNRVGVALDIEPRRWSVSARSMLATPTVPA